MLKKITIKNFAAIDSLEIDFRGGLNVLSGETGAGKSIIIESINFLFGKTRGNDIVRTGEKEGSVSAVFYPDGDPESAGKKELSAVLEESGISGADDWFSESTGIIIKRTVTEAGKSRYFINNEQVNKNIPERISENLVKIFGQNDRRFLIDPASQRAFLDEFAGNHELLASAAKLYAGIKDIEKERELLNKRKEEASRIKTINSYIVRDVEKLEIKSKNDDDILKEELKRLENINSIKEYIFSSIDLIENEETGIIKNLNRLVSGLSKLSGVDPAFKDKEALSNAENAKILLEDVLLSLEKHSVFELDEGRLNEIRSRLDGIIGIENKYGVSGLEELLSVYDKAKNELTGISGLDDRISGLDEEHAALKAEFLKISVRLREKRKTSATMLEKEIERELLYLGIKPVFRIELTSGEFDDGFSETGLDDCLFMFSANPGEAPRSLSKVASGGELSRISLCILKILNKKKDTATFVFDEIDAGIGGDVANFVGDALKSISAANQVILITHLAQVSSFADRHFFVYKEVMEGKTFTRIKELSPFERIAETARMLSGDAGGEAAAKHAKEILRRRGIIV